MVRARPDRLEFIRLEFERAQRDLSRETLCESLGQLLAEQFPNEYLAFARWDDGRVYFGCPDTREELKASSLPP
ncbi:MAG TPA: hypothetical protein VIX91_10475 [Candidatus Acidoferrum sp.]